MRLSIPVVLLALIPAVSRGEVMTFQDGVASYAGTQDTFLVQDGVRDSFNWGARYDLYVGPYSLGVFDDELDRTLIRFDVSALAGQYSQITRISLELSIEGTGNEGNTVELRTPTDADGDWIEGTSDGSTQFGASSWMEKQLGIAAWSFGPGLGTSGFGPVLASTSFIAGQTGTLTWSIDDAPLATALIDGFLDGVNEGFLLKAQDESFSGAYATVVVYSSEAASAVLRPRLSVEYLPEPIFSSGLAACIVILATHHVITRVPRRQS